MSLRAAINLTRKAWRRVLAAPGRVRQQVRRFEKRRERFRTYRAEWGIERDIARIARGSEPIIVGPWLSEVGYEVLYWIPFVRWVQVHHNVSPSRFVVVSRGGASAWYQHSGSSAIEMFDLIDPATFAARNAQRAADGLGTLKQFLMSPMDLEIIDAVKHRIGAPSAHVLHPSILYRLFHQFWLGHRPDSFYDSHTRHARITASDASIPAGLPDSYVAVKFYTATSLPAAPAVRQALESLVETIAEATPVVMLDTGMTFDDHHEHVVRTSSRVFTLSGRLEPRSNLAVQTAVIARANAFVGTCGALAWLAPMLGIDTVAVMADPRFLHHHLQVARRVYQRMEGAGRFSVLDLGACDQLGVTLRVDPLAMVELRRG